MKIDVTDDGPVAVVSLEGDFVIGEPESAFNRAVSRLVEDGRVNLVIDLSRVRSLDSSGLGALVRALAASQSEGGLTKLLHVTPRIGKLLEVTQLGSVFEIFDDRERAISSF